MQAQASYTYDETFLLSLDVLKKSRVDRTTGKMH